MEQPLSPSEILAGALADNKVTPTECIRFIARKMRKAKRALVVDKEIEFVVDASARAEAAETLLAFLGFPKTTRTEHFGSIDHNLINRPYESLTPDQIRAKIAALDQEIENLDEKGKPDQGKARRRKGSGKVGTRKKRSP